jgi:ATP-binding cassette, subfamily B, bacterial MsbA
MADHWPRTTFYEIPAADSVPPGRYTLSPLSQDTDNSKRKKKVDAFLRALRYLWPHRRFVLISVLCAFVVGGVFTAGLGTMLPVMQILINGDTIEDWVNRKIVEERAQVRLADDNYTVRPIKVTPDGAAAAAGLPVGAAWSLPGAAGDRPASRLLAHLADASRSSAQIVAQDRPAVSVQLNPASRWVYLGQGVARLLPTHPVSAIAVVLTFIVALSIFGNTMRFFQEYYSEKASILAVRDLRKLTYDHALHLRLAFFGQSGTSDVTHRITQDAQGLQDGMKGILGNSIQEPIKAAMALGLAMALSWQITLFIIVFAPLMLAIIRKFGKHVRRAARAALQSSAAMLGQIEATLIGIRVVKANNAEPYERRRFRDMLAKLVREQLRIAKIEAFNTPTLEMCTLIVVCCIVLYASYMVLVAQALKTSTFFLVMACLVGIGESLRKTTKINTIIQKANAAAARLFEVIDMEVERPRLDTPQAPRPRKVLPGLAREIRFDNVTFTYPGAKGTALSGVNLVVERGRSVAVVGRNGSGKTTLLALLPRFYDPQTGRILIDGLDVREVTLLSLRRQIGIVTQDSVIFPGSIAENIAYANPRASREQVIAAARRAFAHEFIMEKPQGYDTVLGEHGSQLSGGQKQRLCIARAILRDSPILIMDEATSQVDAESENLIQQAIDKLMHERTTFVIAHRFSTIRSADSIVVMDRGEIVGLGQHDSLMQGCEVYRQLYERQMGA